MTPKLTRRSALGIAAGALAAASNAAAADDDAAIPVAVLIDQRAAVIDFCGPWEALQDAQADPNRFQLYTVAPTADPIRVSGGMKIVPDFTLANAPAPKVIVIPAQQGSRQVSATTGAKIEWLRAAQQHADITMSICTGAFLLARTGLLDGLTATTHHNYFDDFEHSFPQVHLLRDQRFIDHGSIISTGGLTSGIDGALHVVERYYGRDTARSTAAYMEYESQRWITA
jgi:transcriptional regulator GlxA family with amidase domain